MTGYWIRRWLRIAWSFLPGHPTYAIPTRSGRKLTDRDIYRLADEAARGYDPADFVRRKKP
jgi:hypothetical protein